MSECVVRMEMPENCKKCKNPLCIWCDDDGDFIVDPIIVAVQDFRKKNDGGFPDFCPILCQLPDGHGRLVDKDEMLKKIENYHRYMTVGRESDPRCIIEDAPTIVPAERSET